jgi:hypothetical protein
MSNYEKLKEWRSKNKEKVNDQARRYRKKHPETNKKAKDKYRKNNSELIKERDKLAQRKSRSQNPEAQKIRAENYRLRQEAKKIEIAGRPRASICEICLLSGKTVFDHCHSTGFFRGWICDRCNKMLGLVKDSSFLLNKMIQYLENFNVKIDNKETKLTS